MHKLTLVQKAVNLGEYQDMILKGQLPLVVRLTEEEVKSKEFSLTPFSGFYYRTFDSDGFENQFLHEDRLREAIEEKKIFIPEFIDLEDKMKYVDYISNSNSVDFGGSIVFRDKKRVFKGCQARDSIQKNQPHVEYVSMQCNSYSGFVPMVWHGGHSEDSEELFSLCSDVLYHFREKKEEPAIQKKIQISGKD